MATINFGRLGIKPRDNWSSVVSDYRFLDMFYYEDGTPENSGSFIVRIQNGYVPAGTLPTSTVYFIQITKNGKRGDAFTYEDFTPEQLALLKGDPGKDFKYEDFTPTQIEDLQRPAIEAAVTANQAATSADTATGNAEEATENAITATQYANQAAQSANTAKDSANQAADDANTAADTANNARGWTPVFVDELDGERIIRKLSDYTNGTGDKPTLYIGEYLKADGTYTTVKNEAANYQGESGNDFEPDMWGTSIDRDLYDDEPRGFSFLDEENNLLYFKNSNTGGDWSMGLDFGRGADGYTPEIGVNGNWWIGGIDTGKTSKGEGIPSGGTTNQVLKKSSNTNYDTKWEGIVGVDLGILASSRIPMWMGSSWHAGHTVGQGAPAGGALIQRTSTGQAKINAGIADDDGVNLGQLNIKLELKVDKVAGKGLSPEEYTLGEKQKVAGLESSKFKGQYVTYADLVAEAERVIGGYAYVDGGIGSVVAKYIYDSSDDVWVLSQGETTEETPASIKSKYESNPDTNPLTDTRRDAIDGLPQNYLGINAKAKDSEKWGGIANNFTIIPQSKAPESIFGQDENGLAYRLNKDAINAFLGTLTKNNTDGAVYPFSYLTGNDDQTGIKIRLPVNISNDAMVTFDVKLYKDYHSFTVNFSGYVYASLGNWYQPKAILIHGDAPIYVALGKDDDGRMYVYFSGGRYAGLSILNVTGAYAYTNWNDGWEISRTDVAPNVAYSGTIYPPTRPDSNNNIFTYSNTVIGDANVYSLNAYWGLVLGGSKPGLMKFSDANYNGGNGMELHQATNGDIHLNYNGSGSALIVGQSDILFKNIYSIYHTGNFSPNPTQSTGTAIQFDKERIYGSNAAPITGNLTTNATGAIVGVTAKIFHQGPTPTFLATWKKAIGSMDYNTTKVNRIYVQYEDADNILYTIVYN